MREGSDFNFESVDLLDYKLHKIKSKRGGLYIECPERIRNKRAAINPKNEDNNNCFQFSLIVALNHQNIENHPERISNIKPFINEYNWEGIDFSSHPKDWKRLNKITRQLHLIYYMYHTIKKK